MSLDPLFIPFSISPPVTLASLPVGSSAGDILQWDGSAWEINQLYPFPLVNFSASATADVLDIGFYGSYVTSSRKYTGLFRDATDSIYKLFTELLTAPSSGVVASGLTYADLMLNSIYLMGGTANQMVVLNDQKKLTTITNMSVAGTENQISVNGSFGAPQTGALTLSLPQSIGTGSFARFGRLGLGTAASYPLHINGFTVPQCFIDSTNTSCEMQFAISTVATAKISMTTAAANMRTVTNIPFSLGTNNIDRLTISNGGDITTTGYVAPGAPICGQAYGNVSTTSYGAAVVKFAETVSPGTINNVTGSSGRITIIVEGTYRVTFKTSASQSSGSDRTLQFYIYADATEYSGPFAITLISGKTHMVCFEDILQLAPANYIEIYMSCAEGATNITWNYPSMIVHRI